MNTQSFVTHENSDYVDISEYPEIEDSIEEEVFLTRGRGKDIDWQDYLLFRSPEQYKSSELFKEISEIMTMKKDWKNKESRCKNYICKYSEKRGWKKCPRQYKICFLNTSMDIMTFCTIEEHFHEENPTFTTKSNYHWTAQQEAIVLRGIKNNVKNSLILRNIKDEGAVNGSGIFPNLVQVGVKKRYLKNVKCQDNLILNVEALREYCIRNSSPPDDENVSFVPYHYIEGDTEDTLVMTVIWSTKKLISSISKNLIQDDRTYKLN